MVNASRLAHNHRVTRPMTELPPDPAVLFEEALRLSPAELSARYPCCFLLPLFDAPVPSEARLPTARPTAELEQIWGDRITDVTDIGEERRKEQLGKLLFAVAKRQPVYPDMITVGRTPNNDIVLADASVSKFHAHFRVTGGVHYLLDADSKNGTMIDEIRLVPRRPTLVLSGAVLSFGQLDFRFLSADACHEAIRKR
jgi:hypothetical protein